MSVSRMFVVASLLTALWAVSAGTGHAQMMPAGWGPPAVDPMAPSSVHPAQQALWTHQAGMARQAAIAVAAQQDAVAEYSSMADPGVPCEGCGGSGCGSCCGTGYALSWWNRHGPHGDCSLCPPRWFDISIEYLALRRDTVSRTINLTSDGIPGNAPPNIVLSTDHLDQMRDATQPGIRITGAAITGPGANVEVSYFGFHNWSDSFAVRSATKNLFSAFSGFGNPPFFGGFSDTGQASLHWIEYSSRLDSVEVNRRARWTSENCRFHGSWLMGLRYFRLDEEFRFNTRGAGVGPGPQFLDLNQRMNYLTSTFNDLVGFQMGGDTYLAVVPGLKFGGEFEFGVYGNNAKQETGIISSTIPVERREEATSTGASVIGEASVLGIYSVNSRLTLRTSYTILYVDGVALAPENFNSVPPQLGPRTPIINDNGSVFYHGWSAGFEWTW